jgi:hypothetical protein
VPIYYPTVTHDQVSAQVDDGIDLEDDEAAWEEVIVVCGEIISDLGGDFNPGSEWSMEVKRPSGEIV